MKTALKTEKKINEKKEPKWLTEIRKKAVNAFNEIPLLEKPDSPGIKYLIKFKDFDLKKFEVAPEKGVLKINEINEKSLIVKPLIKAIKENEELVKKFFGKSVHFTETKLDALHYALFQEGVFVFAGKRKKAEIEIEFTGQSLSNFFHLLIVLEKNAEIKITEKHSTKNKTEFLHKCVSEILVGENAKAEIVSLQNVAETGFVFSNKKALIEKNGLLNFVNVSFGGKSVKQKINIILAEENAKTESFACFFADKEQEIDVENNATHIEKNTFSKLLTNSVVKDSSNTMIRGLLKITNKADNSESSWHSNTLMIGEKVKANSLPALEIDTNNVIAGHGSAFGNLNEEELFYLSSRGIEKDKAKKLIIEGYLEPIITKISSNKIQNEIREMIKKKESK